MHEKPSNLAGSSKVNRNGSGRCHNLQSNEEERAPIMSTEIPGSDNPDHPERRRHPRCKAVIPVELHLPGLSTPSRTNTDEISPGGCYLETMFTLPVGTKLTITLWLDGVAMSLSSIVATCYPQVGNGMEFLDLSEEDRLKLEKFVKDNAVSD